MLLLGEPLDASTAHEWGLVNRVVEDDELLHTARDMARRLAALPPQAVRLTKRLMKHGAPDVAGRIAEEIGLVQRTPGLARGAGGVRRLHGKAQAGLFEVFITGRACQTAPPDAKT